MLNILYSQKKSIKAPFRKLDAVIKLERIATYTDREKHPPLTEYTLAPIKFRDNCANGLTPCFTPFIRFKGGFSSRINNGEIYDSKHKKYRHVTSRKGLSDILATYKDQSLISVLKYGVDKQNIHQKALQADQEHAGGHYYLAHNFTDFKS